MKRDLFKKVYIEVTNSCNLSCPFCLKSNRAKRSLSIDEFKHILNEIKPYTQYIYLHVLGEPLLHKDINNFIKIANDNNFFVNITSNGYLISNLKETIRQINISLHSYNEIYKKDMLTYLEDIYKYILLNKNKTYINLRLWANSKYKSKILDFLQEKFQVNIDENLNNIKLDNNVYLNFDNEFIWPDDNNENIIYQGKCYALSKHIAILSDGSIVPCCLDGNAKLLLGNIFVDSFEKIVNSDNFINLKNELAKGIRKNELCQKCNFLDIKN